MIRKATAMWSGGLKDGSGSITTGSGALQALPYSFGMRFGDAPGTNPEELIAAAHAGCFTMALSMALEMAGSVAQSLTTEAKVTLEKVEEAWTVTSSQLTLKAKVPNLDDSKFKTIAEEAKKNCPISRLLNAKISLEATLEH